MAPCITAILASILGATTLQVGPTRTYTNVPDAVTAAVDGDTIEIDAGSYAFAGVTITQNNLTIRGVGGRPQLRAPDTSGAECSGNGGGHRTVTNQKGMFAINAGVQNTVIDNLEISNALVCGDHTSGDGGNGAAVRGQGNGLIIRNAYFHDNQDGVLACPATGTGEILIEYTELAFNGIADDGYEHNVYINCNTVTKFTMQYSYSHHAKDGHLLKTRALVSYIIANRLTDETPVDEGGTTEQSSAVIDVPDGGLAIIIGNMLHKGTNSQNGTGAIWFARESGDNAPHELYVVNNTYNNDYASDTTVMVHAERGDTFFVANNVALGNGSTLFDLTEMDTSMGRTITVVNNLMDNAIDDITQYAGTATQPSDVTYTGTGNKSTTDAMLVDLAGFDWHLQTGSPAIDAGIDPGSAHGEALIPAVQYVHPTAGETRPLVGVVDLGAFEYGGTPVPVPSDDPSNTPSAPTDTPVTGTPAPTTPVTSNGNGDGVASETLNGGANVSAVGCAAVGSPGFAAFVVATLALGRWTLRRRD